MKNLSYIISAILHISLGMSSHDGGSCIADPNTRDISRNIFTYPETVQSENFVVHFTISDVDSQLVNGQMLSLQTNYGYAQSILGHLESALSSYMASGWASLPPDCDETISDLESPWHCVNFGGNSLYDVYISNDGVGMVVPENPYPVEPYSGGYTSYMKISTLLNQHESVPSWSHHVIAHELHHSIQLRYGYSVSGSPGQYIYNGWFFEQTATYMQNVIYPNSTHLETMLGNCNVVTPLTFPHYSIDYPSEIYPYRSALWQKFLVESIGDSSIVRYIWEGYGTQYASGEPTSLFPIYSSSIDYASSGATSLSDAYSDYALWRYFTGSRSISGQYFNEADRYCTASTDSGHENYSFLLEANKGGSRYIELPSDDINFSVYSENPHQIQVTQIISHSNEAEQGIIDIVELESDGNYFYLETYPNYENTLVVNSEYSGYLGEDIEFIILTELPELQGDLNGDQLINVLDVIITVNTILENQYIEDADFNGDSVVNVLDVVSLIELILDIS